MKPYYYVYEYGNKAPRVRHATLEQAETESKRLAEISPGATFEILMTVGLTKVTTPYTFWMDGVIGPHICAMHRIKDGTCFVCGKSLENVDVDASADEKAPTKKSNV
jgi:hypothetical protein